MINALLLLLCRTNRTNNHHRKYLFCFILFPVSARCEILHFSSSIFDTFSAGEFTNQQIITTIAPSICLDTHLSLPFHDASHLGKSSTSNDDEGFNAQGYRKTTGKRMNETHDKRRDDRSTPWSVHYWITDTELNELSMVLNYKTTIEAEPSQGRRYAMNMLLGRIIIILAPLHRWWGWGDWMKDHKGSAAAGQQMQKSSDLILRKWSAKNLIKLCPWSQ